MKKTKVAPPIKPTLKPSSTIKTASTAKPSSLKPSSRSSLSTPPSLKLSFKKKVFTTQKSFTSSLLTYIPNKYQLIAAGNNQIALWDTKDYKVLSTLKVPSYEINNLCYLEHVSLLMGSCWKSRELRLWSIKNAKLKFYSRKELNFAPMESVHLTKNDIICTASQGKVLLFWSVRTGKTYFRFSIPQGLDIRAITPIEEKSCVAVGCKDGTILLVNYVNKQVVMSHKLPFKLIIIMDIFPPFFVYNSSFDLLFAGSCNGNIEVLKFTEKKEKQGLALVPQKTAFQGVRGIKVLEKEKVVVTMHDNQFVRVWKGEKLQESEAVAAKVSQAFSLAVDPKLKQVAVSDFLANSYSILGFD